MTQETNEQLDAQITSEGALIQSLFEQIGRRIVGQRAMAERLVMALIADGHVLLEGLPGLAKTTAIRAVSDATDLSFSRIQFTPDLLPADVLGTQIYDPKAAEFRVKTGPIFANLVLADEINRAPAKVQSALLEAMQEKQVTLGDGTRSLDEPFLVMATQNPIEQEGTYPLPEAQVDRFMFKVNISYGSMDDEQEIMRRQANPEEAALERVVTREDILRMRDLVSKVHVADKLRRYIVQVVFATRAPAEHGIKDLASYIDFGASPRASLNLEKAARVNALFDGRSYVTPQDIKDVGGDILRHRIIPTYEAEAEGVSTEVIVQKIFAGVDVP